MAAGEYVSVSSQSDTENADLARERVELATAPEAEHRELADIYIARGLSPDLADQVAAQLMATDALGARARHLDALRTAAVEVDAARGLPQSNPELIAEHLRLAQRALEAITGRYTADDLLGRIFSTFCLGK